MNKTLNKILIVSLFLVGLFLGPTIPTRADTVKDTTRALEFTYDVYGTDIAPGTGERMITSSQRTFYPDEIMGLAFMVKSTYSDIYGGCGPDYYLYPQINLDLQSSIPGYSTTFTDFGTILMNACEDEVYKEKFHPAPDNPFDPSPHVFSAFFSFTNNASGRISPLYSVKPAPIVSVYINNSPESPQTIRANEPIDIFWYATNAMNGCSCWASRGVRLGSLTAPLNQNCGTSPNDSEWGVSKKSPTYDIFGVTAETQFRVTCSN